ncbi:hypothetical protein QFZ63_000279 [Streptomyces sp. B3I7]|jgi:hypothetical protein|uniref:hypothetical protein n=1 Tax=unclassified Streptomyces TaxID=2593676 RepID=UPI00277DA88A|nr:MULTISPECIES: hypothetical protein [unclassified Streptomyces]MDQ0784786.1 hypothetical protein [Streptomyces sp. B3I8]MDQ0808565.1 hypothetical protein [Streptomyces sp. B3I7]
MGATTLEQLKAQYRKSGARAGIKLDDTEMRSAISLLADHGPVVKAPGAELRYIEGLLRLPLDSIVDFAIIPASGQSRCPCGRTPTALDIVAHAVAHRVHEEQLLRDTVIGVYNLFEFADEGRTAPCQRCNREFTASGYWTDNYMYA